jgi:hypothetical protein
MNPIVSSGSSISRSMSLILASSSELRFYPLFLFYSSNKVEDLSIFLIFEPGPIWWIPAKLCDIIRPSKPPA